MKYQALFYSLIHPEDESNANMLSDKHVRSVVAQW